MHALAQAVEVSKGAPAVHCRSRSHSFALSFFPQDLAARNVLVNAAFVPKIADFGLSREIESATEGAYTTRVSRLTTSSNEEVITN